jgi:hypothetical protein
MISTPTQYVSSPCLPEMPQGPGLDFLNSISETFFAQRSLLKGPQPELMPYFGSLSAVDKGELLSEWRTLRIAGDRITRLTGFSSKRQDQLRRLARLPKPVKDFLRSSRLPESRLRRLLPLLALRSIPEQVAMLQHIDRKKTTTVGFHQLVSQLTDLMSLESTRKPPLRK